MQAESLGLLFTTPVCHKDLLKIQRGAHLGDGVTQMCFCITHTTETHQYPPPPIPTSLQRCPPYVLPPHPSAQALKGWSQLFPEQCHFGASQLILEQSCTSTLISGFLKPQTSWLGFPAGTDLPFLLFVSRKNTLEADASRPCPPGRIYLQSFQHSMFSTSIIICFFLQEQGQQLMTAAALSSTAQVRLNLCSLPLLLLPC